MAEQYVVGQVYEIPGLKGSYGKYNANGTFTGVADPNIAAKETARKNRVGVLMQTVFNGDLSVVPELEQLTGIHYANPKTWQATERRQRDVYMKSYGNTPTGYVTMYDEAQGYFNKAKEYAKIYQKERDIAKGKGRAISQTGKDALAEMYKWLDKEVALTGGGGYNNYNDESTNLFVDNVVAGVEKGIAYDQAQPKKTVPSVKKTTTAPVTAGAATTFANAQTYAANNNGMAEAATTGKTTDTDAYSVVNRATTQNMVGFNQGGSYDTDNRSAVQKYSQAVQGNQLGTGSTNKSKSAVASRFAVSNIFR